MSSSRYIVRAGDSLWKIAQRRYQNPLLWEEIARRNHIDSPDMIYIGQELTLPETHAFAPSHNPLPSTQFMPQFQTPLSPQVGNTEASYALGRAHFFIIGYERPLSVYTKMFTRKVVIPVGVKEPLLTKILNPKKYGFFPRDPTSNVSNALHAAGNTNSNSISMSKHPFGAPRHAGKRYWIDANVLKDAGVEIVPQERLIYDLEQAVASKQRKLNQKISKGASAKAIANAEYSLMRHIEAIEWVNKDLEVHAVGEIPPSAVKGAGGMVATRLIQFGTGVGYVMTAVDLSNATVESFKEGSIKPLSRESTRQTTGWTGALAGAAMLGTAGAAVTVEGGPLALAGGLVGGLVGGYYGFKYGPDVVADMLPESVRSYVVSDED